MLAQYLDLSDKLNNDGSAYVELSNYDYCIIQGIGLTDEIQFYSTISEGAYEGDNVFIYQPNNWSSVYCTNLNTGDIQTGYVPSGIYRIDVVGKYLQIMGGSGTNQKLLIMLAKIS